MFIYGYRIVTEYVQMDVLYVCKCMSLELLDFYIKTILSVTSYRL